MPRIIHIINCLAPNGANKAQLVTYSDGSQKPFGCPALIRAALLGLGARISDQLTAQLESCDRATSFPPILKKRRRKASSSDQAAVTADAAE